MAHCSGVSKMSNAGRYRVAGARQATSSLEEAYAIQRRIAATHFQPVDAVPILDTVTGAYVR